MGVRTKNPPPPPGELRRLYEVELLDYYEIAAATKVGWKSVRLLLIEHGIPLRKRGPRSPRHHGSWKGGWTIDKSGYVLLRMPDHPEANHHGYVRLHRLVMERHLGRRLTPEEVVHHLDDDRQHNHIENLQLYPDNAAHLRATLKGKCPKWTPEGRQRTLEGHGRWRAECRRRRLARTPTPPAPTPAGGPAS